MGGVKCLLLEFQAFYLSRGIKTSFIIISILYYIEYSDFENRLLSKFQQQVLKKKFQKIKIKYETMLFSFQSYFGLRGRKNISLFSAIKVI